ncbi:MAG TPA: M56 family metallopeptidase [Candidatus Dormibacteraeota bacterium]|nr:M56 family metallopeptidase [Candidatus Dormibacteraeota bacterium]
METINRAVVAYLLNSCWQIMLISILGVLCSGFLRTMPGRHRHQLWVFCLAACVLIPAATVFLQGTGSIDLVAGLSPRAAQHSGVAGASGQGYGWELFRFRGGTRAIRFPALLVIGIAGVYAVLLLFHGIRLLRTYRRTVRVRDRAFQRAMPAVLCRAWERCLRQFSIPEIPVLCSEEVSGPCTLGWRNPVLIVPGRLFSEEISEQDLVSALAHELAHVKRRDFGLNLLYEAVSLPLCFHPAMVLVKARIAQTRELACDEMAAGVLPSGKHYARSLLHMAQTMSSGAPSASSNYAMGLFDTRALEERIMNILNKPKIAKRGTRTRMVATACLMAAMSLVMCAFSVRVAANGASTDGQRFVGTWVTKYKGQAFITFKLKSENGVLRGSCVHVDRLDFVDGELIPSSDQFTEQEIVEAKVAGNKVDLRIGGHDSIYVEFTLKGANDADVLLVGDPRGAGDSPDQGPPQKKPWHFQRVAANP